MNRGLPELDLARGRDPLLTKKIAASGNEIDFALAAKPCMLGLQREPADRLQNYEHSSGTKVTILLF